MGGGVPAPVRARLYDSPGRHVVRLLLRCAQQRLSVLWREALRTRRISVQATGDELREYIHVRDAAESSVTILANEFRNTSVLLTGHHPMRFRDLLHMIKEIVGPDVVIDLAPPPPETGTSQGHYSFTPYTFRPRLGRKLVARSYVDLGQGLLECLEQIHEAEQGPASYRPT